MRFLVTLYKEDGEVVDNCRFATKGEAATYATEKGDDYICHVYDMVQDRTLDGCEVLMAFLFPNGRKVPAKVDWPKSGF
jgi:hypothetical protein